jgi:hypothetical protein
VLHLLLHPLLLLATAAATLLALVIAAPPMEMTLDLLLLLEEPALPFRSLESLGRTNWMLSSPNSTTWTMPPVILLQELACLLQLHQETILLLHPETTLLLLLIPRIFELQRE